MHPNAGRVQHHGGQRRGEHPAGRHLDNSRCRASRPHRRGERDAPEPECRKERQQGALPLRSELVAERLARRALMQMTS
jgi:hypothetical protein